MSLSRTVLVIAAVWESLLAVPIIGGMFVISWMWGPLIVSFMLGFAGFVVCAKERRSVFGSVLQMIAGVLGFVPFVGWALHVVAALVLWLSAVRN